MRAMDDMALLREYATSNSEAAFETLVSRRVGFVYSAALRQVRNADLAGEITQAVFIILAQKAGRISDKTILTGWLFKTTRFAALAQMRAAAKRRQREQEAQMQTELQPTAPDLFWEQMSPLLDEALATLGETDRQAVLLRFFENKSLAEVGSHLGTGEDTARKRVSRALEKLHRYFSKRGVSSTTAIIAGTISAHSVQAAPVALAKSVTAVAVAKGAAAGGSTLTLIKGALKIMAWTKVKTIVVAGAAVLFATGTAVVVVEKVGSHGVAESFWEMKLENLEKAPPVVIIRPPRYSDYSAMVNNDGKVIAHNMNFAGLIEEAYSSSPVRTVLPTNIPQGLFDLMLTLPKDQKNALRREIQKNFGFIARHENIETNVLLLTVKDASLLAAHRSKPGNRMHYKNDAGFITYSNFPISQIARNFEWSFQLPVILQGGCAGNYDFQWQVSNITMLSICLRFRRV
jgi:RNA polymerase sigma factor (sigma-70 family)